MNCWKAINIKKQYGTQRMFYPVFLNYVVCIYFSLCTCVYVFVPTTFNDQLFLIIVYRIMAYVFLFIKFFIYLPLFPLGNKVKKSFMLNIHVFPYIQIKVDEPIAKWLFLLSLLAPFIVINSLLVAACYFFNHYVHYFIILLAYHIGLCVSDFICAKNVLSAPNQAYIEENEDGFEILVRQSKIQM